MICRTKPREARPLHPVRGYALLSKHNHQFKMFNFLQAEHVLGAEEVRNRGGSRNYVVVVKKQ